MNSGQLYELWLVASLLIRSQTITWKTLSHKTHSLIGQRNAKNSLWPHNIHKKNLQQNISKKFPPITGEYDSTYIESKESLRFVLAGLHVNRNELELKPLLVKRSDNSHHCRGERATVDFQDRHDCWIGKKMKRERDFQGLGM